jgi:mono/diheme cytochrome c family protein
MKTSRCFALLALLTLVGGVTIVATAQDQTAPAAPRSAPRPAPAAPAGDAQKGQQLFTSYGCYECHGREAQGSTATGPRLAPRPIAFAAFTKYVRGPSGQMPPFTSKVVSDADLADIYAFLQSRPQPPAADSIPLLK